jgi:hypothetical protein
MFNKIINGMNIKKEYFFKHMNSFWNREQILNSEPFLKENQKEQRKENQKEGWWVHEPCVLNSGLNCLTMLFVFCATITWNIGVLCNKNQ